jgi:5-methylcytosine-specific restriction endonuclease McrA
MLIRISKPMDGNPLEACYVAERASPTGRPGASSARTTQRGRCRQPGSGTKRASVNGLSATFPRGASGAADSGTSRPKGQRASSNARVFVLDKHGTPLMPCSAARAREFLDKGRAVVVRLYPFTIRLKDRVGGVTQPIALKIDPGSKTTGLAIVRLAAGTVYCLWLAELEHRGAQIHKSMGQRRAYRRGRRKRALRYRPKRVKNRRSSRERGIAPSLRHRVETTATWVRRLAAICPVASVAQELVKFDTQQLQNPSIEGIEYQNGVLAGYERREWLLEKDGRRCAYCDKENVPLQIDHILCRARGGTWRPSNLTLACGPCNQRKGDRLVAEFLAHDPGRLAKILARAKAPLKDAAAVNATRWALYRALASFGLPVTTGSGGRTKWNRTRLGIPKDHALDALCVGEVDAAADWQMPVLCIHATGRGRYQRTLVTASGSPRGYKMRVKRVFGFATGDIVRAIVPLGKNMGVHIGRVAVRTRGEFSVQTATKMIGSVSHKNCRLLMRADGYAYSHRRLSLP